MKAKLGVSALKYLLRITIITNMTTCNPALKIYQMKRMTNVILLKTPAGPSNTSSYHLSFSRELNIQ